MREEQSIHEVFRSLNACEWDDPLVRGYNVLVLRLLSDASHRLGTFLLEMRNPPVISAQSCRELSGSLLDFLEESLEISGGDVEGRFSDLSRRAAFHVFSVVWPVIMGYLRSGSSAEQADAEGALWLFSDFELDVVCGGVLEQVTVADSASLLRSIGAAETYSGWTMAHSLLDCTGPVSNRIRTTRVDSEREELLEAISRWR